MLHDRIHRARVLKGLSLQQVADALGDISKQALSKYEQGRDIPSSRRLLRLAEVFGIRPEYFFRSDSVELGEVDFRKHSTFGKRQQEAIKEQVREHLERYLAIERLFESENLKAIFAPYLGKHEVATPEQAEAAADALRKDWRLGSNPIRNLTESLEEHGIKIIGLRAHERFDGLCARVDNGSEAVIVSNTGRPGERQRFNLAHELGHLVMSFPEEIRGHKEEEQFCHRFAGAFLFPREEVIANFGVSRRKLLLNEFLLAKEEWGISAQAILRRLFDLDIISSGLYQAACRDWSSRGYRRDEPRPLPREHSYRMRQLAYRALAEDLITPSRAAELLGASLSKIERILSNELEEGRDANSDIDL